MNPNDLGQVTSRAAYHQQSYSTIGSRQVSNFDPKIGAVTLTRTTESKGIKLVDTHQNRHSTPFAKVSIY